ncbi:MAG: GWxTD domain-containing protein [Marinoscillum sp.]|jgi:GWxTD domain-containing protein
MGWRGISILVLCWLMSWQVQSLDLTSVNLSYQYDLTVPMQFAHRVVSSESGVKVFFKVEGDSLVKWRMDLLVQPSYASLAHDTLRAYTIDTLVNTSKELFLGITFDPLQNAVLLITMAQLEMGVYLLEDIQIGKQTGFSSVYPKDIKGLPILEPYITSNNISFSGADSLHVYEYTDNFESADPPMGLMRMISPSLDIDTSYYFDSQLPSFKEYRFYLIQQDTLSQEALTILKCPPYFPEYKSILELVDPLTYITTSEEIKSMTDGYSKKAFEQFWIGTFSTKFRAKNAIKLYYDRIEKANQLFTDYKQGWKTDRGMLYIVFGPPDVVKRDERTETWTYRDGYEFEFIRISTLFAPLMYSLKRNRRYENLWYQQVGEIRKGL